MNADFQFESDGSELGLYSQGDIYFVTSQERLVKKSHLRENIGPVASQEQYYVSAMLKPTIQMVTSHNRSLKIKSYQTLCPLYTRI